MEAITVNTAEEQRPLTMPTGSDGTALEDHPLVEEELLVEEVSIDGMCGVY